VHILYLVSAFDNPLYEGRYELHGRYMTFGQHSFILDLVAGLARRGERITLAIEGIDRFPISDPLRRLCRVIDPQQTPIPDDVDLVLLDEGSDRLLGSCPCGIPAFRIVHNAAVPFSAAVIQRCQRFICLTERSFERLSTRLPGEKLLLAHQGVDLMRFRPPHPRNRLDPAHIRVLIYSRLDANREPTIWRLLEQFEGTSARVTLLGDGDRFWSICDRFAAVITPVHFVPCTSIHHVLSNFDLVISSARGVMEALAMGIPALCGGYEYAGPVVQENIGRHLTVNITGFGMGTGPERVWEDTQKSVEISTEACRSLAETYCSVDLFIDRILQGAATLSASNESSP
jgi:glycosyltransferase involved in cell wall biosynthesis